MAERWEQAGEYFVELLRLMARLRAPGGCPWDQKQTFDSIKPHTLEETYEVMDAIDAGDWEGLQGELGDLMLQPVFLAEIARGEGLFDIADCLQAINEKLVRRHPHIFADAVAETAEEVKLKWEEIKGVERATAGKPVAASVLDGVPRGLPALVEAGKIAGKAAAMGFDWPTINGVMEKMTEEAAELAAAQKTGGAAELEHELGDLLFTAVNLARFLKVDSEQALRKANARFRRRFAHVERGLAEAGVERRQSLEYMEQLWQEAKRLETGAGGEDALNAGPPAQRRA